MWSKALGQISSAALNGREIKGGCVVVLRTHGSPGENKVVKDAINRLSLKYAPTTKAEEFSSSAHLIQAFLEKAA